MPRKFDRQKFSEKMLAGFAKVGQQTECDLIVLEFWNDRKPSAACALGAAAIGHRVPIKTLRGKGMWWPGNTEIPPATCPAIDRPGTELVDCENQTTLDTVITHLNDDHWWSIPNIARWIVDPAYRPTDPRSE